MGLVNIDLKPFVPPVAAVATDAQVFLKAATALVQRIDRIVTAVETALAAQEKP